MAPAGDPSRHAQLGATAKTFVYKMTAPADTVFVALDRSDSAQQATGLPPGEYVDLVSGTTVRAPIAIPPRSARVLGVQYLRGERARTRAAPGTRDALPHFGGIPMRLKLLAATMLIAGTIGTATARPLPTTPDRADQPMANSLVALADRGVLEAMTVEHETSARVRHYASVTMIAERDLHTARIQRAQAFGKWDDAVTADDPIDAGTWALRHAQAMADERDALGRATLYRAERDIARADFKRAIVELKRAVAKRERAERTIGRKRA